LLVCRPSVARLTSEEVIIRMTCNDEASVDPWMKALEARFRRADSHNYDLVFSTKSIRTGRIEQEDGGIQNQRRRGKPLAHSEQKIPLNHLQRQYRQAGSDASEGQRTNVAFTVCCPGSANHKLRQNGRRYLETSS
jgi:hypothetical protein